MKDRRALPHKPSPPTILAPHNKAQTPFVLRPAATQEAGSATVFPGVAARTHDATAFVAASALSSSPEERGLTLLAMGESAAALVALRHAASQGGCRRSTSLTLGKLLRLAGDTDGADEAGRAAENASADPKRKTPQPGKLESAERELRAQMAGKPPDLVELLLRSRLRDAPADAAALRVLAETIMQGERYSEAERLLQRALDLAPSYTGARHGYALALFRQHKEAYAIPHVERLLAQHPNDLSYRILLASCLLLVRRPDRAIMLYESALREAPRHADLWQSYSQALRAAGRRQDSIAALRTCIEIAPDNGQAYWNMFSLSSSPPPETDIAAIRGRLAGVALSSEQRFQLHYALASALEKHGVYAESFQHYAEGAKLYRTMNHYQADDVTNRVRNNIKVFTPAFFAARSGWGYPDTSPIFILGLPRAGSTLIEQILASHSEVEGTQELPEIWHIANELEEAASNAGAGSYPGCLARFAERDVAALGRDYIERAALHRKSGQPYFIDKMPGNWLEVGLILTILPNAKIIDARRNTMANGFAAFSMYFSHGMEFSYGLGDIGHYYNDYVTLMEHFDNVVPGRVHRVLHENLVDDTETEIRRLLDYCGLPFEPECLRFWENKRVVATASSEQVRRPIFRDGLDHWRHYEPWLEPLRQALNERTLKD